MELVLCKVDDHNELRRQDCDAVNLGSKTTKDKTRYLIHLSPLDSFFQIFHWLTTYIREMTSSMSQIIK